MENQKTQSFIPNNQENGSHKKGSEHSKNLYADARSCAVKILCRCERTDSYLEKLIDAELKNDTLNFNIVDKTKFIYRFKTTLEVSPRLELYNIYFLTISYHLLCNQP